MNQITDIVTVKNAIFVEQDNIYSVLHYGTEILKYDRNQDKLIKCLRHISKSSTKAINQAVSYLNLDIKDVPRNLDISNIEYAVKAKKRKVRNVTNIIDNEYKDCPKCFMPTIKHGLRHLKNSTYQQYQCENGHIIYRVK